MVGQKLKHGRELRPTKLEPLIQKLNRKIAELAIFFCLGGCIGTTNQRPVLSPINDMYGHVERFDSHLINGVWANGIAILNLRNGKLTYRRGTASHSIRLDLPEEIDLGSTVNVYFSVEQTVIITARNIILSLGAEDILNEREMIGANESQFMIRNALNTRIYPLEATQPSIANQHILDTTMFDGRLFIMTETYLWWLDLNDGLRRTNFDITSYRFEDRFQHCGRIVNYQDVMVLADTAHIQIIRTFGLNNNLVRVINYDIPHGQENGTPCQVQLEPDENFVRIIIDNMNGETRFKLTFQRDCNEQNRCSDLSEEL